MPYICFRRTDIPEGVLQILDLWPNTSLRNAAVDPPGQTKYVSFHPANDTVVTNGGRVTITSDYYGIAAYLLDHIVSGGLALGTGALSDANANAAALSIAAHLTAGDPMTEFALDTYLSAVVAGTGFATGGSTGVVQDLLAILTGERYRLPVGSDMEAGGIKTAALGAFVTPLRVRRTYNGMAFEASNEEGKLSVFKSATFEYLDITGAALVVYSDTGIVL